MLLLRSKFITKVIHAIWFILKSGYNDCHHKCSWPIAEWREPNELKGRDVKTVVFRFVSSSPCSWFLVRLGGDPIHFCINFLSPCVHITMVFVSTRTIVLVARAKAKWHRKSSRHANLITLSCKKSGSIFRKKAWNVLDISRPVDHGLVSSCLTKQTVLCNKKYSATPLPCQMAHSYLNASPTTNPFNVFKVRNQHNLLT